MSALRRSQLIVLTMDRCGFSQQTAVIQLTPEVDGINNNNDDDVTELQPNPTRMVSKVIAPHLLYIATSHRHSKHQSKIVRHV